MASGPAGPRGLRSGFAGERWRTSRRSGRFAAFHVADDLQPQVVRLADQRVVGLQAFPEVSLEERNVDLHRRDDRSDDPHRLRAEIENRVDSRGGIEFVVHLTMGTDGRRQSAVDGIQTYHQRRLFRLHGGMQPVKKKWLDIIGRTFLSTYPLESQPGGHRCIRAPQKLPTSLTCPSPATKLLVPNVRITIITARVSGKTEFAYSDFPGNGFFFFFFFF